MTKKLLLTLGLAAGLSTAQGQLFDLADATASVFEHDSDGTNSPSPIPAAGSQSVGIGTFEWGVLATDTTSNTAEFSSSGFTSSDWGGEGTFTSNVIDVSGWNSVNIEATFSGSFNVSSEFSNFFYQIDANPVQVFGAGAEDVVYSVEPANVLALNVTGASNLVVGFTFNHNGSSDSFDVESYTVTGATAVPEASATFAVLGVFGLVALRRRRA